MASTGASRASREYIITVVGKQKVADIGSGEQRASKLASGTGAVVAADRFGAGELQEASRSWCCLLGCLLGCNFLTRTPEAVTTGWSKVCFASRPNFAEFDPAGKIVVNLIKIGS